jgi:hypothetical protein
VSFKVNKIATVDLAQASAGISGSTVYTGYPIHPHPHLQDGEISLREGVDYWIKGYGQNIFVSDAAYVHVEGLGSYTGERYIWFDITPAIPSAVEFPVIDRVFEYDANLRLSDISLEGLGQGDGVFSWKDEETTLRVGDQEYEAVFLPNDAENYDYSDLDGWEASSKQITRSITLSMQKETSTGIPEWTNTEAKAYPNPVHELLRIDNGQVLIKTISITDLNGRRIAQAEPGAASFQINVSSWTQGVYIITIESETGIRRLRVVKK